MLQRINVVIYHMVIIRRLKLGKAFAPNHVRIVVI